MEKIKVNLYKLFLVIVYLLFSYNISAQEVVCFKEKITDATSFNVYTGKSDASNPIKWSHTIPPGILESVKRVALYVEAYDIDYPSSDEEDRVYVNGRDIGLLEGFNNSWVTVEKTIPKSILKQGINNFQVDVNTKIGSSNDWKVKIRSSELRFYCNDAQEDFVITLTPDTGQVEKGEVFDSQVSLVALNNFNSKINLRAENLPQGVNISFESNNIIANPNSLVGFKLDCGENAVTGVYTFKIVAEGGEKIHSKDFVLEVLPDKRGVKINVDKDYGYAPFKVGFSAVLENFNEISVEYHWDFGTGETSKEKSLFYTFKKAGDYNVKLTVTDSKGNKFYDSKVIKVKDIDYKLTKNFEVQNAQKGAEVYFVIEFINSSSDTIENLVISDKLSSVLTYIEDDFLSKPDIQGKKLVWNIPLLKSKEKIKIRVKVKVSEDCKETIIYNTATLIHKDLQYELESNTAKLNIENVNLKVIKSVDKNSVTPGEELNYSITVKNLGKAKVENLKLEDKLFKGLTFLRGSKDLVFNNGVLTWQGNLDGGDSKKITIKCKVDEELLLSSVISNMAVLTSPLGINIESNRVETVVQLDPSLETKLNVNLRHRVQIPQTEVGRVSVFKVEIENNSNYNILNPMVTVILPQGFSYVENSTLLNNVLYKNPTGKREISWEPPYIKAKSSVCITYGLIAGSDSKRGKNISKAILTGLSNSNERIELQDQCLIALSSDTFSFYCDLEGIVFLDENSNGNYDTGDVPVGGVEVVLSNGDKSISDEKGRYKFTGLYPGSYALGVNKHSLNERFKPASFTQLVTLSEGILEQKNVAIQFANKDYERDCNLKGRLFFDKDSNGKYSSSDILVNDFTISIDDRFKTNGQRGSFIFTNLTKGNHRLKITYGGKTIYKSIVINDKQASIDIPVKYSGIKIYVSGENK